MILFSPTTSAGTTPSSHSLPPSASGRTEMMMQTFWLFYVICIRMLSLSSLSATAACLVCMKRRWLSLHDLMSLLNLESWIFDLTLQTTKKTTFIKPNCLFIYIFLKLRFGLVIIVEHEMNSFHRLINFKRRACRQLTEIDNYLGASRRLDGSHYEANYPRMAPVISRRLSLAALVINRHHSPSDRTIVIEIKLQFIQNEKWRRFR